MVPAEPPSDTEGNLSEALRFEYRFCGGAVASPGEGMEVSSVRLYLHMHAERNICRRGTEGNLAEVCSSRTLTCHRHT